MASKRGFSLETASFLFISESFSQIMFQILNSQRHLLVLAVKFTNKYIFFNHKTNNGAMIPKLNWPVVPLTALKLFCA